MCLTYHFPPRALTLTCNPVRLSISAVSRHHWSLRVTQQGFWTHNNQHVLYMHTSSETDIKLHDKKLPEQRQTCDERGKKCRESFHLSDIPTNLSKRECAVVDVGEWKDRVEHGVAKINSKATVWKASLGFPLPSPYWHHIANWKRGGGGSLFSSNILKQ